MQYNYQLATPKSSRIKEGVVEAYSYQEAESFVKAKGLKLIALDLDLFASLKRLFRGRHLDERSTLNFFTDLARFLKAGLTINEACSTIQETNTDKRLKRAVEAIKDDLSRGTSLSEAVSRTKAFSDLSISVLKAGEQAGALRETALFLEDFYRRKNNFSSEIKRAVFYPKIVLFFTICALIFLAIYVLPKFQDALSGMGATNLPPITNIVMSVGMFINRWWVLLIIGIVLAYTVLKGIIVGSKEDRFFKYVFNLPVIGEFAKEVTLTVIFMNLAVLEKSGINVSASLEILSRSIPYPTISRRLSYCKQRLDRGESLSTALKKDKFFPVLVPLMVQKGETSGQLAVCFEELASITQSRISSKLDMFQKLVEPLLLAFIGGIVLLVYMAFFMVVYPAMNSIAAG